jgi:hypothetical protein
VNNCWWWTEELFETCRASFQNTFYKLVRLVGFIIRKFVTMHGHMNVKFREYSPFREAVIWLAAQQISLILCNLRLHCRLHDSNWFISRDRYIQSTMSRYLYKKHIINEHSIKASPFEGGLRLSVYPTKILYVFFVSTMLHPPYPH